jgi:hypothetical protein
MVMVRFYDAKDENDLARVESLLKQGGVEYFLAPVSQGDGKPLEIEVAEEDVPRAEEMLQQNRTLH